MRPTDRALLHAWMAASEKGRPSGLDKVRTFRARRRLRAALGRRMHP